MPRTPKSRPKSKRPPAPSRPVEYKIVELSTVDEAALEGTVNEWVGQGWAFDGVQFAMRESSKRPAMAFVFFTRAASPRLRSVESVHSRGVASLARDPWARLAQLAGEGDEP